MKNYGTAEIDMKSDQSSKPSHLMPWFDPFVGSSDGSPIVSARCSENDSTSLTSCGDIRFAEQGRGRVSGSGKFTLWFIEGDAVHEYMLDPNGAGKCSRVPRIGVTSVDFELITAWRSSWSLFFLKFDPSRVADFIPSISYANLHGKWAYALDDWNEDLILAMKAARESFRSNSRSSATFLDSIASAVLPQIFLRCNELSVLSDDETRGLHKRDLRRVIEFINSNLARKLAVPEIAQVIGMTPWHFSRGFKKSMGVAPYQYVLQCRIARAKEALRRTGTLALTDLASDLGFCDQTQFGLIFKRQTGMTPTEFAKLV